MIVPNKVISLEKSALGRIGHILALGPEPRDLLTLYRSVSDHFESADQFLVAMDILYVMGRIDLDPGARLVTYAR